MANGRITKAAVEKEIRLAEKRLKTIEKHTGAKITINKDAVLSVKSRAKAMEQLQNIKWSALKQGASFSKDFINMKVEGHYWTAKAGTIETTTEVQGKDAVKLLKAVAGREKITKQKQKISISGQENIQKAIDWFEYFKTEKQWKEYIEQRNETIMKNFRDNLVDLMESGKLSEEEVKKVNELRKAIYRNPQKWAKIIIEKKLYDISGVNMFDSEDLAVDIANNYDDIMAAVESELGVELDSMDEESAEETRKYLRKKATEQARKNAGIKKKKRK